MDYFTEEGRWWLPSTPDRKLWGKLTFDADGISLEIDGSSVEVGCQAQAGVPDGVVLVPRDVEWPIIPRQGAPVRAVALQTEEVTR